MDFYNDLVTQKSWQTLGELRQKFDFILIGGWAVYLYTKALKSKDIDVIVDYDQLEKLRRDFAVTKNERLKKYEARREEVQIDVYLPHFSDLGVPVEQIIKEAQERETFRLPNPEMLLILKQLAFKNRELSAKGQKDRIDILSLLTFADVDLVKYRRLLTKFKLEFLNAQLNAIISQTVKIPELGINEHQWSRKKKLWIEK
ncbi:MAG: hypothetical protein M1484_04930 [Patescibacteria group bacterium]|nr:hypothetical protein [Patescibacteria group bacterium]